MKYIYFLFLIFFSLVTTKAFANPGEDLILLHSKMQSIIQTCQQLKDQNTLLAGRLNNCESRVDSCEEENRLLKDQNEICEARNKALEARCEKLEKTAQVLTAQDTQLGTEIELVKSQSGISGQNLNDVCSKVQELSAEFRKFPSRLDEYLELTHTIGELRATEEALGNRIQLNSEKVEKLVSGSTQEKKLLSEQLTKLANHLRDREKNPGSLGAIQQSHLNEREFQAINGNGWVFMDGRNIQGSDLHRLFSRWKNIPDARGVFFRGYNYGRAANVGNPDGDLPIGTYQTDCTGRHRHHLHGGKHVGSGSTPVLAQTVAADSATDQAYTNNWTSMEGGNETRPRCIIVNVFIKINNR